MLACECLNVIIESETEGQKVAFGELQLTEDEVKDPFFRQVIKGGTQLSADVLQMSSECVSRLDNV